MEKKNPNVYQRALDIVNNRINPDISQGGGNSVPKPLTYDYMPEGYPTKTMGHITLMEEQEISFTYREGFYQSNAPVNIELNGENTYRVIWDGSKYDCGCIVVNSNVSYIGNPAALGLDGTLEPFLYAVINGGQYLWVSYDTSESHTIGVTTYEAVYEKIDTKFLPIATSDTFGISKTSIRVIDPDKNYTTSEIQTICDDIMSGSAIYRIHSGYITSCGGYIADTGYADFEYIDGNWFRIEPTEGIWSFSNYKVHYPDTIFIQGTRGYIGIGSGYINQFYDYPAVEPNSNTMGLRGRYIQADNAIVLKISNRDETYWISADADGKLNVKKCKTGSINAIMETTLFQNGEDSIVLASSTTDSTKKFKITVDDSGAITATEVT